MPRFVIIDPSVTDFKGHHLEYALRVLEAARNAGAEPVLATNRRFSFQQIGIVKIVPHFSYTFWENQAPSRGLLGSMFAAFKELRRKVRSGIVWLFRNVSLRLFFSRVGLDFQRSRGIAHPLDSQLSLYSADWVPIRSSLTRLRLFWLVHRIRRVFDLLRSLAARFLARLPLGARRTATGFLKFITLLLKAAVTLVVGIFGVAIAIVAAPFLTAVRIVFPTVNRTQVLERELRSLVEQLQLDTGDIIFVPTCAELEMSSVAQVCSRSIPARRASWRLMFRREIFMGRQPTWQSQLGTPENRRLKMTVAQAVRRLKGVDVRWLTDTDPLTAQYALLGMAPFETAPIPVSTSFEPSCEEPSKIVRLGYLGDARTEKGFAVLPDMWDTLVRLVGDPRAVRLLVQSNFNIPGGEPAVVRGMLALLGQPAGYVELAEGPFDRDRYLELFKRIDLMVVPYDEVSYASRSSGVFAEALKGGLPCLVSSGTWMSGLVEPYRQAWLAMIDDAISVASYVTLDRNRGTRTVGALGQLGGLENFTHLMFQVDLERPAPGEVFSISLTFLDASGAFHSQSIESAHAIEGSIRVLTRIPTGAARVDLGAGARDNSTSVIPARIVITGCSLDALTPCAFGVRATSPTPHSLAHGGFEIISAISSYRRASQALRSVWSPYFDDAALVRCLMKSGSVEPPSATAAKAVVQSAGLALPALKPPRILYSLTWAPLQ